MFSIREIIDIAIRLENNGENYYREALKKVSNPSLESHLVYLADQEREHARWFEEFKNKVKVTDEGWQVEEMTKMLQNLIGDQSFSLKEIDISEIDEAERLIEAAIEFEKDTVLFYEMLQSFIEDPETAAGLNVIIEEENRHIQILNDYIISATE